MIDVLSLGISLGKRSPRFTNPKAKQTDRESRSLDFVLAICSTDVVAPSALVWAISATNIESFKLPKRPSTAELMAMTFLLGEYSFVVLMRYVEG